jgi:endonuclease III
VELYPETPVPLEHGDAFTLLIAVLLSAQCTDVRVNQITPRLFGELGRGPEQLATREVAEIEAIVRPCGSTEGQGDSATFADSIG